MAKQLVLLLIFSLIVFSLFSLSSLSSPLLSESVLNAADTLSDSGFVSMALTLKLVSQTLVPQPLSATIFSPSDAAFIDSGQPPLSLIKFHVSPLAFSVESLRSLPFGTTIPTMLSGKSLIVTTLASDDRISINNLTISGSAIYDDGSLIVFGIEKFFDPNFTGSATIRSPSLDLGCVLSMNNPRPSISSNSFREAISVLRSMKYSVMASFLEMQLLGFSDQQRLTVLAPLDEFLLRHIGNFTVNPSLLFLRHVVPCKLLWHDLVEFGDGRVVVTSLEGFKITITSFGEELLLNGVEIIDREMYSNDWLVVHGLAGILTLQEKPEQEAESAYETGSNKFDIAPDRSEF